MNELELERNLIYLMYGLSLMLSGVPLGYIVATGRFAAYYVYCIALLGFMVMNLLGSVSGNILVLDVGLPLQGSLLATALVLALLYPVLASLRAGASLPLACPRALVARNREVLRFVRVITWIVIAVVTYFSFRVAAPTLFRIDRFGDWNGLLELRAAIVFGTPRFHWYALFFFAIPAFLTCIIVTMRIACRRAGLDDQAQGWRLRALWSIPLFLVLSVAFLHKSYLVVLLVQLFLIHALATDRAVRPALLCIGAIFACVIPLYVVYGGWGFLGQMGEALVHRIFEVYAWTGALALHLFPAEFPFLDGRSLPNFAHLFAYAQVDLSRFVYPYIYGDANGSAPVPALYEMYANFGWTGFAIGLFVVPTYIVALSLLSWRPDPVLNALAMLLLLYGAINLWTVPFWFGALDIPLLVVSAVLWASWQILIAAPGLWQLVRNRRIVPTDA